MTIGVIGAMQMEVDDLKAQMTDTQTEVYSGVEFVEGKIGDQYVVAAKCGIGKVFAAICAEAMILKYDEDGNPIEATATRFLDFGKCIIYPNTSAKLIGLNDGQKYVYSYEVIAPLSKQKYKLLPCEGDKVMITKKDGTINKTMEVKGFTTYKKRYLKLWL